LAELMRIEVWEGCATGVASAVERMSDRWEPYSTESRRHSMFSLFEELIVPALTTYLSTLSEHHRGRSVLPNISLAKLARVAGFGFVEDVIHSSLLHFIKTGHDCIEFEGTLETLRVVASRCRNKLPKKVLSPRANRSGSTYCEFCGAHSETVAAEKDKMHPGYDRGSSARLSVKYCWAHRPKFLDRAPNPEYLWAARHKVEFETELKRLSCQARSMSKPSAETGDPYLDLFYLRVLAPLAAYPSDTSLLRNEARRIVDARLSDKRKRIVVMRAAQLSLAKVANEVGANSRQAVAKALASIPAKYRFDLATYTASDRHIDHLKPLVGEGVCHQSVSSAHARFIELLGPVAATALQDPDIVELLLNDDGSLFSDSRSIGMRKIGALTASEAEQIIRFAALQFPHEQDSSKERVMVELPFANARFTGVLPPVVDGPVFGIRKGIQYFGPEG
jgi:hypothetical protein